MNTGFKSVMTAVTVSVFLTLSPLPLHADMQAHIGPLNELVELGQDGAWTLEDKGGWFTMTNASDPGAIKYYWMGVPDSQGPDYGVSLNVVAQSDGNEKPSFAGLIFNYRANDRYMGVTIGTDGGGYLFIRTPDGFKTHRAEKATARNDGSDIIRAHVSDNNKVRFELNGETMYTIDGPDGFSSKLGVMAIGQGMFGFTGFTVF